MSNVSAAVQAELNSRFSNKLNLWTFLWEKAVSLAPHILTLVAPFSKCT